MLGELTKSAKLSSKFKDMKMTDYFDDLGQRKYRNLSLTFPAMQSLDMGQSGHGASGEGEDKIAEKKGQSKLSARAYRLATEMIQQDRNNIHLLNQETFKALNPKDKFI